MNNKLDKTTEATKDLSGETGAAMRILAFELRYPLFLLAFPNKQTPSHQIGEGVLVASRIKAS